MYNPIHVSNNFIELSFQDKILVSPMKLQKMLYFLYRDYMKSYGKALYPERFMTWQYGPVLGSVYNEFKHFRSAAITDYGVIDNKISQVDLDSDSNFRKSLYEVWRSCRPLSATYLSELTHKEGSAWYNAWQNRQPLLSDEDIRKDNIIIE